MRAANRRGAEGSSNRVLPALSAVAGGVGPEIGRALVSRRIHKRCGIKIALQIAPKFGRMSHDLEVALFRVLQESLTNVHRHSGSPEATVRLASKNGIVTLQIIDQGKGIQLEDSDRPGQDVMGATGVGLRGMKERISQLGGTLEVSSSRRGTAITATVPLSAAEIELQLEG
jgi:two-component system NarL family sensor kinase